MAKILITAGATRNPIDSMRCITANASGRTGVYIGQQLSAFDVELLGSPLACLRAGKSLSTTDFGSTHDLMSKMLNWIDQNPKGTVVHSAAVGDFQMKDPYDGKISSSMESLSIELVPAPKILPKLKRLQSDLHVVSFKAAPPDTTSSQLHDIAEAQRIDTQSDMVFANVLGRINTGVLIATKSGHTWFAEREQALTALVEAIRLHTLSLE